MANELADEAWENLLLELRDDEGVTIDDDGLSVHGTLFAFRDDDALVVDLPVARASDLAERGVARRYKHDGETSRDWSRVTDLQLWSELAREAHEYGGEPAVGGES